MYPIISIFCAVHQPYIDPKFSDIIFCFLCSQRTSFHIFLWYRFSGDEFFLHFFVWQAFYFASVFLNIFIIKLVNKINSLSLYNLLTFSVFTGLCNQHDKCLVHFHYPQKKPHAHLHFPFLSPTIALIDLFSKAIDLSFLDVLHS